MAAVWGVVPQGRGLIQMLKLKLHGELLEYSWPTVLPAQTLKVLKSHDSDEIAGGLIRGPFLYGHRDAQVVSATGQLNQSSRLPVWAAREPPVSANVDWISYAADRPRKSGRSKPRPPS